MQSKYSAIFACKERQFTKKTEPEHDKTYKKIIDFLRCAYDERSRTL